MIPLKLRVSLIFIFLMGSGFFKPIDAQQAPSAITIKNQVPQTGINNPAAETLMRWWAHHMELKNTSEFKDLKWRTVGPEYQSGRIQSIASHPKQPSN